MQKTSNETFPQIEERILKFWNEEEIFKKSLEMRAQAPRYSFYDGPPFATGLPHYGHIMASVEKDVVPRYWTMKGRYVERVWGWDCHGLPIENIAEKELGIKEKKQIEEIGIDKFEEACRSRVLGYVKEWEKVIPRLGRWVDMENAYRTMDLSYMESVWWVFKSLWDRGLIYEGYRSMHICPRCETTLSQSEVSEGYRDVKDLSAIAKFELIDEPGTYILAWTTTPWTLIGNVALAINRKTIYCKVQMSGSRIKSGMTEGEKYIVAKERLGEVFKDSEYHLIEEFNGADLVGKKYKPLFDYYAKADPSTSLGMTVKDQAGMTVKEQVGKTIKNRENGWKVYAGDFVTTEDGTGVVHIAPAFGEDDMNLGKEYDLPFVQHVGMNGVMKSETGEFAGMHVKPAEDVQKTDVEIIKYLAAHNLLFHKEKFEHSYPHCWRCDTPLINYATSSWFVAVTKIKTEAMELARKINWSPNYVKEGRFGNWLKGARDWSISRQRYWASVMPIWRCECGELQVFGSVSDLEKASGQKITDLHKFAMDKIEVPCKCGKMAHRIPDVLDTWFDSGSMPYAQMHYPFENKEKFEQSFPADFIAEAVEQARTWFYYLHVLAVSIKNEAAFKNVVAHGIILAEDGKKMSKRLQNYPDPQEILDKYGADVLRMYLMTSPVMGAENLNFSEKELMECQRGIFRMLWNSYQFFEMYANGEKFDVFQFEPVSLMDKWILSELNQLIKDVDSEMENYDLYKAARLLAPFLDNLSNWYVRRSRKRFVKGDRSAFQTLQVVFVELSKLMAPFTPFMAEEIYKNLTGKLSVHLEDYPKFDEKMIDYDLNEQMLKVRKIVELGLALRAENNLKVRQPLGYMDARDLDKLPEELVDNILDELNVKEVNSGLEKREVVAKIESNGVTVWIDTKLTDDLINEGNYREIVRHIQDMRKFAGYRAGESAVVGFETSDEKIAMIIEKNCKEIQEDTASKVEKDLFDEFDGEKTVKVGESSVKLRIKKSI